MPLPAHLKSVCRTVQLQGNITYNGHGLNEFVVERTAGYVDQQDTHLAELTVRETFDFAAQCQGPGARKGALACACLVWWVCLVGCVSV